VLATIYNDHPWIVHGALAALGFLSCCWLFSREYFDRLPTLKVHVDPGEIMCRNRLEALKNADMAMMKCQQLSLVMCPCCSCVTAEANDKFSGGRAPQQSGLHDIPCYDPSTQAFLGTLPAMTPDEVGSVTFGAHNALFHQRNPIWTSLMSAHAVRLRRPVPALRQSPLMQCAGEGQDQGRARGVAGDTSFLMAHCHGHVPGDACAEMQRMREQYGALEYTCSIIDRSSNPHSCDCNASRSQPFFSAQQPR